MPTTVQLIMLTLVGLANGHDNNSTEAYHHTVLMSILSQLEGGLELHLLKPDNTEHNLMKFILSQWNCSLTINRMATMSLERDSLRHHLMIFKDVREMSRYLPDLINRDGFYILGMDNSPMDVQDLLQFMSDIWLTHGHSRIYYIQLDIDRIVLYNPFKMILVPVDNPLTYNRIYANLYGYPLRVYTIDSVYSKIFGDEATQKVLHVTGADAKLSETVAKYLNYTQNFLWPDNEFFGGRTPNGSYSGGVGHAHRREIDIIFSGYFIKDYLSTQIQFSPAVYMDNLCLYVQKAKRIPQSILPLFAVHEDVWLCFLLVGSISAFIWLCLRGLNLGLHIERIADGSSVKSIGFYSIAMRIFIDTWVVWVRVNVGRFPPFNSERMFLVSLCLVSVIFGALLESSLATVYIRPLYYRDTNTLAELDATHLPIYIKHPAFKDDLFYGHDSAVYRRLDARMMLVADIVENRLIALISKFGTSAGVTRSASLELNDIRYVMTKRIHKIPECPKNYHIAYVMPKPSPYLDGINMAVLRIVGAGLMNLWTGEMKERAKWSIHKFPEYLAELGVGRWKILTLTDVQLAFYALAIGCLFAFLVWLIELWLK